MKLGFGTQRLPLLDPKDDSTIDYDELFRMVDHYIANGGRYFDVARPYHSQNAETAFRKAVAERYPRDAYEITGKFTGWLIEDRCTPEEFFQSQLKACGVEYFDMYMYHALNPERCEQLDRIDGWNYVRGLLRDGRIKRIGLQFHDGADTLQWVLDRHPEIEVVHLIFNYAEWKSPVFELQRCYDIITSHGCEVITMYPVMQGVLQDGLPEEAKAVFERVRPGMRPAAWALRWAAELPGTYKVLVDNSSLDQIQSNVEALKDMSSYGDEDRAAMEEVMDILRSKRTYPCTGCDQCLEHCPHNLAISKYIELYNDQRLFGIMPSLHKGLFYGTLVRDHGIMALCKDCDRCVAHCPEHIDIPQAMAAATKIFDYKIPRPATPYDRFPIGETENWKGEGEIFPVTVNSY